MSADKYSLYYCLTESGWKAVDDETNLVSGWVCLFEKQVYQGSSWGRTSSHWHKLKTNPAWTADDVDRLEKQFPKPEPKSELSPESLRAIGG
jgi:hypothetical protein